MLYYRHTISQISSFLYGLEEVVVITDFWLDLTSLHVRTWPFVEQNFGCYDTFNPDYLRVEALAIFSLGIQPPLLQFDCFSNQIHHPNLKSRGIIVYSIQTTQVYHAFCG